MGRERQKRKNRSSISKVKPKLRGRTKAGRKKVDFLGSAAIAENWDRNLTVSQNYKRLGLSSRLNATTGGTEKLHAEAEDNQNDVVENGWTVPRAKKIGKILPGVAKVERDPETGRILRVIHNEVEDPETLAEKKRALNPLNDPLNDLETQTTQRGTKTKSDVVAALEAQAGQEAETLAKRKRPRQQRKREREWISALIEKHRDDTAAMMRDRKLNPNQESQGVLRLKIQQYRNGKPTALD